MLYPAVADRLRSRRNQLTLLPRSPDARPADQSRALGRGPDSPLDSRGSGRDLASATASMNSFRSGDSSVRLKYSDIRANRPPSAAPRAMPSSPIFSLPRGSGFELTLGSSIMVITGVFLTSRILASSKAWV